MRKTLSMSLPVNLLPWLVVCQYLDSFKGNEADRLRWIGGQFEMADSK